MTAGKLVAFITGANKGIGLETARQLAPLGYTVIIGSRTASNGEKAVKSLTEGGADAHYTLLDVTDAASISAAVKFIETTFGRLDVLINNAGGTLGPNAPDTMNIPQLRSELETNLLGVINVTNAFLPLLKLAPEGRIVVVSSALGSKTELQTEGIQEYQHILFSSYNITKAAVNMYAVTLAVALKDTPIKVNVAHPGWVRTDQGGPNAPLSPEEGAETSVFLATLPQDGPTGKFYFFKNELPW